jgi:glycosyltransferase involved in cell wall biosynthesis
LLDESSNYTVYNAYKWRRCGVNICLFTKHEVTWGSSRNRIYNYIPFLQKKGYNCEIMHLIPSRLSQIWLGNRDFPWLKRKIYSLWHSRILRHLKVILLIAKAKKFDCILIQKVNIAPWLLRILKYRNNNLIFDFDDLCFIPTELIRQRKLNLSRRLRFWWGKIQHPKILAYYKYIIAGNRYLAESASYGIDKARVVVIPTSINCDIYFPKRYINQRNSPVVIGWTGTGETHLRHLGLLKRPLESLSQDYDIVFKLIGACGSSKIKQIFKSPRLNFKCVDWVEPGELPETIRSFDIGVMPLLDNEESRGKCGFKVLEYMACGVAVVASPVGFNKEIIKDNENGFLAGDELQWWQKLLALIKDERLRIKFGRNGRQTVEELYSLQRNSEAFIRVIENTL